MRARRPVPPPAALLAAGLVVGAGLAGPTDAVTGSALPVLVLLTAGGALLLGPRTRRGLTFTVLAAGFLAGALRSAATAPPGPVPDLETGPSRMVIDVTRVSAGPSTGAGASWWLEGAVADAPGAPGAPGVHVRVPVTDGQDLDVLPGDRVRLALCSLASDRDDDGTARALIARTASPGGVHRVRRAESPASRVAAVAARVRRSARRRLTAATGDPRAAALLACLLVGDRDAVAPRTRAAFRQAGLAHLLAVSGLHVVLLARVAEWLLRRALAGWVSARRLEWALTTTLLPGLVAYAIVCGLAVPVVRAVVFLCVARVGRCLDRRTTTLDHLAIAAVLVLLAAPEESRRPGFHLSFAAVAGLALLTKRFEQALFPGLAVLRAFPEAVSRLRLRCHAAVARATSSALAAHVGAAPVVAAAFGDVHVIGPLANVPAVALTAWLLPAAAFGAALGGALPAPGRGVLRLGAHALLSCAEGAAAVPFATLATGAAPVWAVLVATLLLVTAAVIPCWRRRHLLLPLASLIVLGAGALGGNAARDGAELRIIDVGHGQAILLRAGGATVLVDAGGRLPHVAADRITRALDRLGVREIDLFVLTHEDVDHCGAAGDVLAVAAVDTAVVAHGFGGDPAAERALALLDGAGTATRRVGRGDVLEVGGVVLTVLHPRSDLPGPVGNAGSVVLHVTLATGAAPVTALLPGDVEGLPLEALSRDATLPRADVLVLPHHGRGPPQTFRRLAQRLGATHLVASARSPTHVVLRDVLVTGRDGTVTVTGDGISTER